MVRSNVMPRQGLTVAVLHELPVVFVVVGKARLNSLADLRRHRVGVLRGTPETENMSVEEYESLGARFFGLIFKDATVYPAVRKKAAEFGFRCVMLSEYQQAEAREAGLVDAAMAWMKACS